MTRKGKTVTLELLAGVFGWVWFLASVAVVVALIRAIGFSGPWMHVGFAFAAAAVARWLAKGLHENKLRTAFEAQLVAKGVSPEDAERIWSQEYARLTTRR